MRRTWGWLLALGILLIVLGIIALIDSVSVSLISMLFFGWVLVIAGIIEAIQAFRHRHAGRHMFHVLNAVLAIVVGAMLLLHPVAGLLIVTLLLAIYFTVAGVFRIAAAASTRVPGWGWSLMNGIITLILGILIWAHWPVSSLWIVGLFIGIDLVILGWSEVMLALALRRLPAA
jgi:uncharacterized membrane protein HdeD (DUF308 family)